MTAPFTTKDSGQREQFPTGARRDVDTDKPRYELIPVAPLTRLANLYARGAEKYGIDNWRKGFPFRRTFGSLLRHAFLWAAGDRSEDHLAAIVFNAFCLMQYEEDIACGKLPAELDDVTEPRPQPVPPDDPQQFLCGCFRQPGEGETCSEHGEGLAKG